ncbi:MAG: DUF1272 domain-containing protein [Bacteroidia bacterium]
MSLEMRSICEACNAALDKMGVAFICTFECTYCAECAQKMGHVCPSCSGELVRRPRSLSK